MRITRIKPLLASLCVFLFASSSLAEDVQDQVIKDTFGSDLSHVPFQRPYQGSMFQTKDALAKELLEKHRVDVPPKGRLFDEAFLAYLLFYLDYISDQVRWGSLRLVESNSQGARLVGREKTDDPAEIVLAFSSNAGSAISTSAFRKLLLGAGSLQTGDVSITFEFSNELFEQLSMLFLSDPAIDALVRQHYGIELGPPEKIENPSDYGLFTRREKIKLLKCLMDLPSSLTTPQVLHKLKYIARMRAGFELRDESSGKVVAADYSLDHAMIRITDAMYFKDEDKKMGQSGEGTFFHELGHAFWFAFSPEQKRGWTQLSWIWSAQKKDYVLKEGYEAVSAYSIESLEEDFPEHFSAFVDNPERLKSKALGKYRWLQENLFVDTEYFSTVASNLRLFVPSALQDTVPPSLALPIEQAFSFQSELAGADSVDVTMEIVGLFDDLSGVNEIWVDLQSADIEQWKGHEFYQAKPINLQRGQYRATRRFDRARFWPDSVATVRSVSVKDSAGNERYLPAGLIPGVFISGKGPQKRKQEPSRKSTEFVHGFPFEKLEIRRFRHQEGWHAAEIVLPIPEREDLRDVRVNFEYEGDFDRHSSVTRNGADYQIQRGDRLSKPGEDCVRFVLLLPSYYTEKTPFRLSQVRLSFEKTKDFREEYLSFSGPTELDNLQIHLEPIPGLVDATQPAIDVNSISMELDDMDKVDPGRAYANPKGNRLIRVWIPIAGLDQGEGRIGACVRTPSGKELSDFVWLKEEEVLELIRQGNGVMHVPVEIPLPPFPEEGEYLLTYVQAHEDHCMDSSDVRENDYLNDFSSVTTTREELLERGIRQTIRMHIESPLQDNSNTKEISILPTDSSQ